MTKLKNMPSDEQILKKSNDFSLYVDKVVSGEVHLKSKKKTVADKLDLVKDQLLKLKDKSLPYSVLVTLLDEKLGLKVSEQTLRAYCQNRLGFPKKGVIKVANKAPNSNKNDSDSLDVEMNFD